MSVSSERGKTGEAYVREYLSSNGWDIVSANYRIRGGEIDIIAKKDNIITFVEVKTRKYNSLDNGLDAVDRKKRTFIVRAAQRYIEETACTFTELRFDVAVVSITTESTPRVLEMKYYENAFDAFDI